MRPGIDPKSCRRHPLFFQFLDLPPATAKWIITIVILTIVLMLVWRLRRGWALPSGKGGTKNLSSFAPEWAVACAFAAILSPLAWHQHLVLVLPCGYLVIRDALIRTHHSWIRFAGLGFVLFSTWIVHRDPLSKLNSLVAMSYHFDVVAVLILIVLTLTIDGAITTGKQVPQKTSATFAASNVRI